MATQLGIHDKTLRAFAARTIRVGDLDIQPACMAHIMALRMVCPGFEEDKLLPEEMLSAIVVFSTPPAQASELLSLPDEEWDARRRSIAGSVMLADLGAYGQAIQRQIAEALAPAIPAKGKGAGKKKAPSAGGSKSMSAPSPNTARRRR